MSFWRLANGLQFWVFAWDINASPKRMAEKSCALRGSCTVRHRRLRITGTASFPVWPHASRLADIIRWLWSELHCLEVSKSLQKATTEKSWRSAIASSLYTVCSSIPSPCLPTMARKSLPDSLQSNQSLPCRIRTVVPYELFDKSQRIWVASPLTERGED